ncbi:MAG: pilus assembly protein PilI [Methylophaga sp.]|nr:MAG: pilus assembly protein PilI [Methylophaga sp.]
MTTINSPEAVISLLQDIELRSKQQVAGLSQHKDAQQSWSAIGFKVGKNNYLIPLGESREIFPVPTMITPIPKSVPWAWGMANLRGELLPIFDLNHLLLGKATKPTKHSRVMVINHPDLYSGLLVDEVLGLKHFQQKPAPIADDVDTSISPYLTGSISQQDVDWDIFSFTKLANAPQFLNAAA